MTYRPGWVATALYIFGLAAAIGFVFGGPHPSVADQLVATGTVFALATLGDVRLGSRRA